jgi:hypothetical protein
LAVHAGRVGGFDAPLNAIAPGRLRYNERVMADENAPATKNDLRQMEDRLSEQMRDMQTELLKAFLPWQDNVRIQFRELEVNTGNSELLLNPPAA